MTMKKMIAAILALALTLLLAGCGDDEKEAASRGQLSYDDAAQEVSAYFANIKPTHKEPKLDTDLDFTTTAALADISTFPLTTRANADIVVEIATATELSNENAPDDWLNIVATSFNRQRVTLSNGKTVGISVRKIASGETVTYMVDGDYRPDAFIPSCGAWGEMLQSRGFRTTVLTERLVGNTAGILMKRAAYNAYVEKHGEITVSGILSAALDGELIFAVTNPYTSSTGLNMLSQMLYAFDQNNPLSETAVAKLIEYQKIAPVAAYTTAVMRESAKKGIVDAMAMEAQAYVLNKELSDYVYTPVGFRHDHPVITFDYVDEEKQEALRLFTDYCLGEEAQSLATKKGFNLYEDFEGQDDGLSGGDYFSAQAIWKKNKNGGRPVVAVFVADISGSMNGRRINSLKQSLLDTIQYIDSENYIGLVSYDDRVYIDLDIGKFDNKQRAYFSGAVKGLSPGGNTATYSATAVGLKMLLDARAEIPDAQMMLFVLTDGETNTGYSLKQIAPMVQALGVPVYTIAYETSSTEALKSLSSLNEAACISATVEVIVNELRSLFNVSM